MKRKFWGQSGSQGTGLCVDYTHVNALSGQSLTTWIFPGTDVAPNKPSLVLTKAMASHPHKASRRVGYLVFKRLVTHTCTGQNPGSCKKGEVVADVYKIGFCVKCNTNIFPSTSVTLATDTHRKNFVTSCLPTAIDPTGQVKANNRCTGDDLKLAEAAIAGF